jgi:hypothetical protein
VRGYYQRLLRATAHPAIAKGSWSWCSVAPEGNLLAWCWTHGDDRLLVVLNLSDAESWGRVALPWHELGYGTGCILRDLLADEHFGPRDGKEILEQGLFVGLPGWGVHLLELRVDA